MKRVSRVLLFLGRYLVVAVLGFIVGVLALYIYLVRSGPALELWHTEKLTGEFSASSVDEIVTLDDYRSLERALFEQLDAKIYARTKTGQAFALARYSPNSLADPRVGNPDWNRTFELTRDTPVGGVLLLHGMSDSPYSLRAIGKKLHQRGYWVVGLRLPGHGTAPSGLMTATWEDMAAAVELGMRHLATKVSADSLHIIGYSTGAPLALNYELDVLDGLDAPAPASMVFISPAIGVTSAAVIAKWQRRFSLLPGLKKLAWEDILPEFDPYKYNSFAINAGEQVYRLTTSVAKRLKARAKRGSIEGFPPTLVLLSAVDATVSTEAVINDLFMRLAPEGHELILFDINRKKMKLSILVPDPAPITARLLDDDALPFMLTLVTNEHDESTALVARRKTPFSAEATVESLDLDWPSGVISLSHIALPFPPDDPLYGRLDAGSGDVDQNIIHLGQIAIQGERGLFRVSSDWLMRLRYNPFYTILETRVVEWLERASQDED